MTTCPPAALPKRSGMPLVVASMPRSGTHMLIDLLLNNLPAYRGKPLYVNIDGYLAQGLPFADLLNVGAVVIKTHYPFVDMPAGTEAKMTELAKRSVVLHPMRNRTAVLRSMEGLDGLLRDLPIEDLDNESDKVWSSAAYREEIPFTDMIDRQPASELMRRVARAAGVPHRSEFMAVPPKGARLQLQRDRVLTRVVGHNSPRINTTIRLGGATPAKKATLG